MSASVTVDWVELNQRQLTGAMAGLRRALEHHVRRISGSEATTGSMSNAIPGPQLEAGVIPLTLDRLRMRFDLSSFECDLLLLCAAIEFETGFAPLCAAAQGDPTRTYPTFSLALAALDDPHWSAIAPDAPLRRWRLIEIGTGTALTTSPLRIDERILHYLAGVQYLDSRLASLVDPLTPGADLVPSHQSLVEQITTAWSMPAITRPVLQLVGSVSDARQAIAAAACRLLGMHLHRLPLSALHGSVADLDQLVRLWDREAFCSGSALLLDCDDHDTADSHRTQLANLLIERTTAPLIVSGRDHWRLRHRSAIMFDVHKPLQDEQRAVWHAALGENGHVLNGGIDRLTAQFDLSAPAIHATAGRALSQMNHDECLERLIWDASRSHARPQLDDLAERIEPIAGWDELVVPDALRRTLGEIVLQVRQRTTVYETWGFAGRGARGLGISALFAGASGTGKTMAAEVIALDLRLDLYRIDLSSMVSKYIGETEKNLRRVFDAAEEGGAILLFDEADALFGKRSEVKDSHDRYANIEVSYLLQRMETYRGLAILTTNLKSALDPAFVRRIRFIVQFPFPDADQRAEIWRRIYPTATPTEELDIAKLARLNIAGGNIRNIALHAAFHAAEEQQPVRMRHLLLATRNEYGKLEKSLTGSEIEGWE